MHSFKIQRGLSLIELMVGLVLAALLLLGVLQIFDGNRRTHTLQESFSRVQESGRIATDLLAQELRNAAFDGCARPNKLKLVNNTVGFPFANNAIGGRNNVGQGQTIDNRTIVPGTDVLTVRGAVDACGGTGRFVSTTGANVTMSGSCSLQASTATTSRFAMLANCRGGEITRITAATSTNITVNPPFANVYGSEARIYRPYVRTYFISTNIRTGEVGLYMDENGRGPQELVPGVEDLQLSFGRATGSKDVVDIWGTAPTNSIVSQDIAAVRLQIVVAAPERSSANPFVYTRLNETKIINPVPNDGHLRKQYLVMTKVRNRGVR